MTSRKSKNAKNYFDPALMEKYYEEVEYFIFKKGAGKKDYRKLLEEAMREPELVANILAEQKRDNYLKARDLLYQAWDAEDDKEMVRLAKKALKLDPASADAHLILATFTAKTDAQSKEMLLRGIEGTKQFLGKNFFKTFKGEFNKLVMTKPYMRSLEHLAALYWEDGEHKAALKVFNEMLVLNPSDIQGVRFLLLPKLLYLKKFAEAEKFLLRYKFEDGASWLYSKAYLLHKNPRKKASALKAVRKAFEQNPFVVDYLLGKRRLPEYPDVIRKGMESEAIAYVHESIEMWASDSEAAMWLLNEYIAFAAEITGPETPAKGKN